MRRIREILKLNRDVVKEVSSELGVEEEKVPTIVEKVINHPKFLKEFAGVVAENPVFLDALSEKMARDERVRSGVVEAMSRFFGRRSFLEALLVGGAIATGIAKANPVIGNDGVVVDNLYYSLR